MNDETNTNGIEDGELVDELAMEAATEAPGEPTEASESSESPDRISELEGELNSARERHLRLAAEFDNYRKRVARDQADNLARAQSALMGKLVEVVDDFDRVTDHADGATKDALLAGVELVERKLKNILEAAGLERIVPEGVPFDPATMEALTTMPTENAEEDEQVGSVFQPGYMFQGTLLRPARVVVKKHEG
jgi:molecular chaperone GrpE